MHPATIVAIVLLFIFVVLIAIARFFYPSDGHTPIILMEEPQEKIKQT